ncbi:hypothetical protein PVL30_000184 [Lodderomyces elongisporus]|uniref:Uncharacterized protein n=1 Tax=Lodderomyces elongisporus (strain ATCC 11503 / CBS 2605 / JCM 1781 / NBRC 1676 / NRRL YB-4239) TaxID=379508 RepID=A5DS55_LODEL|nr:uncharacterized protein PVL30_000184 [Lodderomyces elongisporus]EDK42013.1 conserved hypothetical protein [Lodderomyces elongisporus NRRL YB-4239]WLF76482.1 hypothetical protein PVL30_000184 [Lodderomyces elongisporus]
MFQSFSRPFSLGRPLLEQVTRTRRDVISPKLAGTIFRQPDLPLNRERKLRRKEKRLKRQIVRDVNTLKQHELQNVPLKVDPVLGDPKCNFFTRIMQKVENSEANLAFGIDRLEMEKIIYAADKIALEKVSDNEVLRENEKQKAQRKKDALLTILNLKNTDNSDKRKMAVKFAREELQREPGDTASPEVQAAVSTVKIHFMMRHVKENKHDHPTRLLVRNLVQSRQKILRYLKKKNPERYYYALAKLGLTDDVVVKEFTMGYKYLQDYQIWGDQVLVKETQSEKKKKFRLKKLREKVNTYHEVAKKNYEIMKTEGIKPSSN